MPLASPAFKAFLFVFGLVLLIAVELLRWLANMPPEPATGLTAIAWLCLAGPPSLTAMAARRNGERGFVRAGPAVLLALAGVFLVGLLSVGLGGCLARQVRAEHDAQVDWTPRPQCRFEAFADGESVFTLTAPTACEPPPNVCPAPPAPTPEPEQ